jgi:hypothetical protein
MKMTKRGSHGWLSLTVGLAVLAGCVSPATTGMETSGRQGSTGSTPMKPSEQQAPATVAPIDNGEQTPLEMVQQPPALNEEGLAAVDKVTPVAISAAEGGKFVSEDGLLTAIIPPGALSQDAQVRFVRLDTSNAKNTDKVLAGMRFQMDLGDAYVNPGQKLMVSAKADDRLISELKSMYPDYDPARFSLSQDEKGNWMIAMPLNGPAAKPMDLAALGPDPFMTDRRGVMTEGFAPLPAGKGGNFKKDSRIEAFCDYAPPPPPKPLRTLSAEVKWESDDPALDGKPAYDPNPAFNAYVRFGNLTTAQVTGVEGFWTREPVPAVPAVPEESRWDKVIGADSNGMRTAAGNTVRYGDTDFSRAEMERIDDEFLFAPSPASRTITVTEARQAVQGKNFVALDGNNDLTVKIVTRPAQPEQPATTRDVWNPGWIDLSAATNETVRSGYEHNGNCHCRWVVHRDKIVMDTADQPTNANGVAVNQVRETFTIGVLAITNAPNPTPLAYPGAGVGSTAQRTITSGNNTVSILVPKYSPMLGLDMLSRDLAMSGEIDVIAQVEGVGERTYTYLGNNSTAQEANFRVRLPDDTARGITIKEVRAKNGSLYATQASLDLINANLRIQRNGIYRGLRVDLVPGAAK